MLLLVSLAALPLPACGSTSGGGEDCASLQAAVDEITAAQDELFAANC